MNNQPERQPDMFLIVDVESTCGPDVKREDSEIIEIGYVALARDMHKVHVNYVFIRPIKHPQLTDFCKNLTHISQADVDNSIDYPDALRYMSDDLYGLTNKRLDELIMVSWGKYDREMFVQCGLQHHLEHPYPFMGHINLKREYAIVNHLKSKGMGLQHALEHAGLQFQGSPHRGVDDALNVSRIMIKQWPNGYTGSMQFM